MKYACKLVAQKLAWFFYATHFFRPPHHIHTLKFWLAWCHSENSQFIVLDHVHSFVFSPPPPLQHSNFEQIDCVKQSLTASITLACWQINTLCKSHQGNHLKAFYSKFENILNDSLSLIKLLEKTKIDHDCFFFAWWTSKISAVIYQWKMR